MAATHRTDDVGSTTATEVGARDHQAAAHQAAAHPAAANQVEALLRFRGTLLSRLRIAPAGRGGSRPTRPHAAQGGGRTQDIAQLVPDVANYGYDNDTTQYFTVPEGVYWVDINASGGSGGIGGSSTGNPAPGGDGADVTTTASVTPGEVLVITVGQQGQPAAADSETGGAGGLSSGNPMNGGSGSDGASGVPGLDGGGGGGGGTEVDAASGPTLVAAGGGGGGGGSLTVAGGEGGAGGSGDDGVGANGSGSNPGVGGPYAAEFQAGGGPGGAAGGGGGGGGFSDSNQGDYGGGAGGSGPSDSSSSAGGGGGGAFYVDPSNTDNVISTSSGGDGSVQIQYFVPPTVTSVTPSAGAEGGGQLVEISGSGFDTATAVYFGSNPVSSFTVESDSEIVTNAPTGTGRVDVTVTNGAVTSATSPNDIYTYLGDSSLVGWGFNADGDLGTGYTSGDEDLPVTPQLAAGTVVTQATEGLDTGYALTSTGAVYAWGEGSTGELGNATDTAVADTPVEVALPTGTTVKAIAAEGETGLALTTTGAVYAWGSNPDGELGNASTTSSDVPVKVDLPAGIVAKAIAGEMFDGLALTTTGAVYAWGSNPDGELGNGTTASSDVPLKVDLPTATTAKAIAGGGDNALALTSAGGVLAWGYNGDGELGNGSTTSSSTPVEVDLPTGTTATAISAEGWGGLALTSSGNVYDWGAGENGELGNGTTTSSDTPVAVDFATGDVVKAIAGSYDSASALLTGDSTLLTWGHGGFGELGNGTTTDSDTPVAVSLPEGSQATAIFTSKDDTGYALVNTPPLVSAVEPARGAVSTSVEITGYDLQNATAVDFGTASASFSVVSPFEIEAKAPAAAGKVDVTVATPLGTSSKNTATGTFTYVPPAVTSMSPSIGTESGGSQVTIKGTSFSDVTAVDFGSVGSTSFLTESNAEIIAVAPPGTGRVDVTVVTPAGTSAKVAADQYAYLANGSVLGVGADVYGELGNGLATTASAAPTVPDLPAGTVVTQLAFGLQTSYALSSTGAVYAWGFDSDGELGNGAFTTESDTPVAVSLPSGVKATAIASAGLTAYAVTSTGAVYAWGSDTDDALGTASEANSDTPVRVSLPAGVTATKIAAGAYGAEALTSAGAIYVWGLEPGLGGGSPEYAEVPVLMPLPGSAKAIAIGAEQYAGIAVAAGGAVYAWGEGTLGELGNGSDATSATPVLVELPAGVEATAVGGTTATGYALSSTGSLYAWGGGDAGELGNGTFTSSDTPVAVDLPAGSKVTAVGASNDGGEAVTSSGALFVWGSSQYGDLGRTSPANLDTPVRIALPAGVIASGAAFGIGPDNFAIVRTPPTVTAVSPSSGAAGTAVTITGVDLSLATEVYFGKTSATFTLVSPTTIMATAPAGTGTVDITVTTPLGTSSDGKADQFTYGA